MRLSPVSRLFSLTADSDRIVAQYLGVAFAAAAIDWLSKYIVVSVFGDGGGVPLGDRFSVLVTYNLGSAGGVMVGPYTWHLNVLVTAIAITLISSIVRQLGVVDRNAAKALGLVAGGALGNMGSMLLGPEGVADFFAIRMSAHTTIVMNIADAALWTGAVLLIPVIVRLVQAIRAERVSVPVHAPSRA